MSELDEAVARLTIPKTDVEPSGAKIGCICDVCILRREHYRLHDATIEKCAKYLEASYPGHAWLNAACTAIRGLSHTRPQGNTGGPRS